MRARAVVIGAQRQRHHGRPEVRAADADIDDVGELAALAGDGAAADLVGEGAHRVEHVMDVRHDVAAIDLVALAGLGAERDMQHRAVLGDVDLLAREHHRAAALDIGRAGEVEQRDDGFGVDAVLGIVEQHAVGRQRQALEALRIGREHLAHRLCLDAVLVATQGGKGVRDGSRRSGCSDGGHGVHPRHLWRSASDIRRLQRFGKAPARSNDGVKGLGNQSMIDHSAPRHRRNRFRAASCRAKPIPNSSAGRIAASSSRRCAGKG